MAQRSLIEERRNRILDYITTNQKADVHDLSLLLNETEITIRRDLIELEKSKKLIRVHGGAVINEQKKSVWHTSAITDRLARNREKKERIAQFASTLIQNDESIFIDGGSTNQILAPMVKDLNNMLFVTNSPDIAEILLENENNRVLQIGGELTRDTRLTTGPDAVEHIRKYFVDKPFQANPAQRGLLPHMQERPFLWWTAVSSTERPSVWHSIFHRSLQ